MPPERSRSRLARFLALPRAERRLLVEAWCRLAGAAAGLRLAPARTVAAALAPGADSRSADSAASTDSETARALALAVARAAAHHLTPMSCLPRALALRRMLARRGLDARVRIGVRKADGPVAAHAWVEHHGRPLGEPAAIEERFLPLVRGH